MKLTSNKAIVILSGLILIVSLVITDLLISDAKYNNQGQLGFVTTPKVVQTPPRIGFTELIAQAETAKQVLSAQTEATPTPTSIPTPSKKSYTIAIIGDSMAETMGDSIDYLQTSIKKKYPTTGFAMYNYGIGSENIEEGLARFDKPFDHGNRHYVSLTGLKPDILIIGSYAYNPLVPFDKNKHYRDLIELGTRAKQVSPNTKVYLLAEIAPLAKGFGTGPGGVNWPADLANSQAEKIVEQMQNVFVAARDLDLPLIDVYNASLVSGSEYGQEQYVGTHDHIHPSVLGQIFTADIITETLRLD